MGFSVRCTHEYWRLIVTYKYPVLAGKEMEVVLVLRDPDLIRRSRSDPGVLLYLSWLRTAMALCSGAPPQRGRVSDHRLPH